MDEENKNYHTPYTVDVFEIKDESTLRSYMARVLALPDSIKKIMTEEETADYLEDMLGPQFNLSEDQIENLCRVVRDILLGDLFLGDVKNFVAQKLSVDQNSALQIINRVVTDLLAPALEDIKKIQRENFAKEINATRRPEQTQTTPSQQPPKSTIEQIREAQHRPVSVPNVNQNNVINLRQKIEI